MLTRVLADTLVPVRAIREEAVMGTLLRVEVDDAGREAAFAGAEEGLRKVERLDRLLTTWEVRSPMSQLNRAPVGEPARPDPELFAMLLEAVAWSARTGRTFDPAVGALVDAWGLRSGWVRPDASSLAGALGATGPGALTLDPGEGTLTRHHPGAWIDTGAFGKGAALRSAARKLSERGVRSALLDLGGQVLALGRDASTGSPWSVGVAHPAALGRRRWRGCSSRTSRSPPAATRSGPGR